MWSLSKCVWCNLCKGIHTIDMYMVVGWLKWDLAGYNVDTPWHKVVWTRVLSQWGMEIEILGPACGPCTLLCRHKHRTTFGGFGGPYCYECSLLCTHVHHPSKPDPWVVEAAEEEALKKTFEVRCWADLVLTELVWVEHCNTLMAVK
jgi:hypothetical protein